jgi:hypothetical protein
VKQKQLLVDVGGDSGGFLCIKQARCLKFSESSAKH